MGGMRLPIVPDDMSAPDSVPRKKSKEGSTGGLTMNVQDEIKALKDRIAELEEQVKGDKEFTQSNNEYLGIDEFGDECSHELGYFVKKLLLKK